MLMTCPGLMGVSLRLPAVGNILPTTVEIRRSDVVEALTATFGPSRAARLRRWDARDRRDLQQQHQVTSS